MAEVDRVIGNEEKFDPQSWAADGARVMVGDIMAVTRQRLHAVDGLDGRARAFVQVQNGCDHRCTFCIIPFGRGNSRSVPMDDVVVQVRRLVENGYREVVLTGVDITSYAASGARLGTLVKRILREVPELARLRLSSIDSVEADADLIDALANEAAVDAASASVIAGRRRSHLEAYEAAAFAQPCHRLLRFHAAPAS